MPSSRPPERAGVAWFGKTENSTNRLAFLRIAPGLFYSARGVFFCLWNLCGGRLVFDVTLQERLAWTLFASSSPFFCPLGVFLQVGFGGAFWLNILLTLLGYIPGIVHAVYIIAEAFEQVCRVGWVWQAFARTRAASQGP